jgi:hypothetical protein
VFYYFPKLCGKAISATKGNYKEKYSSEAGAYLGAPFSLP